MNVLPRRQIPIKFQFQVFYHAFMTPVSISSKQRQRNDSVLLISIDLTNATSRKVREVSLDRPNVFTSIRLWLMMAMPHRNRAGQSSNTKGNTSVHRRHPFSRYISVICLIFCYGRNIQTKMVKDANEQLS